MSREIVMLRTAITVLVNTLRDTNVIDPKLLDALLEAAFEEAAAPARRASADGPTDGAATAGARADLYRLSPAGRRGRDDNDRRRAGVRSVLAPAELAGASAVACCSIHFHAVPGPVRNRWPEHP